MSTPDPSSFAAQALREAAAALLARAEQIEAATGGVDSQTDSSQVEPLAPAKTADEAKARLVALDLATQGVGRAEALSQLEAEFPDADVASLVDRFFRG